MWTNWSAEAQKRGPTRLKIIKKGDNPDLFDVITTQAQKTKTGPTNQSQYTEVALSPNLTQITMTQDPLFHVPKRRKGGKPFIH